MPLILIENTTNKKPRDFQRRPPHPNFGQLQRVDEPFKPITMTKYSWQNSAFQIQKCDYISSFNSGSHLKSNKVGLGGNGALAGKKQKLRPITWLLLKTTGFSKLRTSPRGNPFSLAPTSKDHYAIKVQTVFTMYLLLEVTQYVLSLLYTLENDPKQRNI